MIVDLQACSFNEMSYPLQQYVNNDLSVKEKLQGMWIPNSLSRVGICNYFRLLCAVLPFCVLFILILLGYDWEGMKWPED